MIYLKNKGEIDIEAIKTMGVTVKNGDNPIGFFGTGLKYAIAVFLRNKIPINLYIGDAHFEFDTKPIKVMGESFDACQIVGQHDRVDLAFTTDFGKGWSLWQAFREIASNTLDEGGRLTEDTKHPESGHTLFCIDLERSYFDVFLECQNKELVYSDSNVEIYEGQSEHIYYRGIRASTPHKPTKYTYNILGECTLTEDRNISYTFQVDKYITNCIASCDIPEVIGSVITCSNDFFESTIDACWNTQNPNETFNQVAQENRVSLSSNFNDYFINNEPDEKKTEAQKKKELLSYLEEVAFENDLSFFIRNDGAVVFKGGLLEYAEEEIS